MMCGNCEPVAHAQEGRQYRYYVSQAILQGSQLVPERSAYLGDPSRLASSSCGVVGARAHAGWPGLLRQATGQLNRLVERVVVRASSIDIQLTATGLAARSAAGFEPSEDSVVHIETAIVRRHRARVVLAREELERRQPDRTMLKAIAQAHYLRRRLETDHSVSVQDLASDAGCTRPYLSVLLRLAIVAVHFAGDS